MPVQQNGSGNFWKWVCGGLLSVLLTVLISGALSWTAFMRDSVSREQVSSMIQKESPYVQDRSMILASLQRIEDLLSEIQKEKHNP